jgi:hypothetical protein
MGFMLSTNPYYAGATAAVAAPYDFGQPIDTAVAAAEAAVSDPALAILDAGCASFTQGNYTHTLQQTDSALVMLPNDTTHASPEPSRALGTPILRSCSRFSAVVNSPGE